MTEPQRPPEARRLFISGRVQGVGYRHHFEQEARRLGLQGWVRNRLDGRVEALIAGPGPALAAAIAWSRQGPPAGEVTQVWVEEEALASVPAGFNRLPTR